MTSIDWEAGIKLCDEIIALCEEIPEEGEEFANSVMDKTESIKDWVETHKHITPKQVDALQNMKIGAAKWTSHLER